ncbi:MAG: PAS domain S-box protein [Pseudomonadota bacterium]
MNKPNYEQLEERLQLLESRFRLRHDAEKVSQTLFQISNAVNTTEDLDSLYASIHRILGKVLDLPNFFIALYDPGTRTIVFPYCVDQYDAIVLEASAFEEDRCLTGEVIVSGRPLFLMEKDLKIRQAQGRIRGTMPRQWIGVPLRTSNRIVGVMAVQSYTDPDCFQKKDMDLLVSVSHQIAVAIEIKRAEQDLSASKMRFQKLTETVRDVIWSMDFEMNYTYISPVAAKVQGWSEQELKTLKVTDVLTPESLAEAQSILGDELVRASETRDYSRSQTLIVEMYRKDGSTLWAEITVRFELDKDGLPCGLLGVTRDVSEQKAAQEALVETEKKYRAIIETTDTGYVVLDNQGTVLDANANYVRFTGRDQVTSIMGRSVMEWTAEHCRSRLIKELHTCFAAGGIRHLEIDCVDLSGKVIPIELNAAMVETQKGRQVMALCLDISDRNHARDLMIQSEKMVSLAGLAAGMAHEINNPLAGILQNTQVVLNRTTKNLDANVSAARSLGISLEDIRAYMEKRGITGQLSAIQDAGVRVARIVENMLCFSRQGRCHFSTHRLDEILDNTLEIIAKDYRRDKEFRFSSIAVVRDYDPCLPQVMCEASTLQQVFINILANGADAMAQSGLYAKSGSDSPTFFLRTRQMGNMAVVEIQDNGPGMNEEDKKHVFEPFFTTKGAGAGTGLGLSLSRFIVTRNHNGALEVTSSPGKGTTFSIKIPIA